MPHFSPTRHSGVGGAYLFYEMIGAVGSFNWSESVWLIEQSALCATWSLCEESILSASMLRTVTVQTMLNSSAASVRFMISCRILREVSLLQLHVDDHFNSSRISHHVIVAYRRLRTVPEAGLHLCSGRYYPLILSLYLGELQSFLRSPSFRFPGQKECYLQQSGDLQLICLFIDQIIRWINFRIGRAFSLFHPLVRFRSVVQISTPYSFTHRKLFKSGFLWLRFSSISFSLGWVKSTRTVSITTLCRLDIVK